MWRRQLLLLAQRTIDLLREIDLTLSFEVYSRFVFGDEAGQRREARDFVEAAVDRDGLATWLSYSRELDVRDILPRVSAPTLVVYPERSHVVPMEAAQRVAAAIPRAEFIAWDVEHFPFWQPWHRANLELIEWFLDGIAEPHVAVASANAPCAVELSRREREVLALIAAGRTDPEIAAALTIAPATASRHVHNILGKLGMRRRRGGRATAAGTAEYSVRSTESHEEYSEKWSELVMRAVTWDGILLPGLWRRTT